MLQGYPQADASAPLTLAGGRLWVTRIHGTDVVLFAVPVLLFAARLRIDSPSR